MPPSVMGKLGNLMKTEEWPSWLLSSNDRNNCLVRLFECRGPLMGQLKAGETVTLSSGAIVSDVFTVDSVL